MRDYTNFSVQKEVLMEYLQVMVALEDWHGVADVAMDLRELEAKAHVESQYHNAMETNRGMNDELLGLRNKVTHLDTALRQVAEMKTMLLIKDKEIESFKNKEPELTIKKKKKEIVEQVQIPETVNDF